MKFNLLITESEEDGGYSYHFVLTEEELLILCSMPYKKSGTNEPSRQRLEKAGLTAFRLGNRISFMYDNRGGQGSIYPKATYAELEEALNKAYENKEGIIRV